MNIENFTAKSNGNSISVEWKSGSENSIARYEIERSSGEQDFRQVSSLDARGSYSVYRYIDSDAFLKGGPNDNAIAKTTYQYRIKAYFKDNSSSYSNAVSVSHNVSSIRRTWGMIKEMFR